jgi:hypothetical protein
MTFYLFTCICDWSILTVLDTTSYRSHSIPLAPTLIRQYFVGVVCAFLYVASFPNSLYAFEFVPPTSHFIVLRSYTFTCTINYMVGMLFMESHMFTTIILVAIFTIFCVNHLTGKAICQLTNSSYLYWCCICLN